MKRLLIGLGLVLSLAACATGNSYSVSKFNDSSAEECIVVTSQYTSQDNLNGIYCKADLTH